MTNVWKLLASTVAITLVMPVLAAQAQPAQGQRTSPPATTPSAVPGYTVPSTHMWEMTSDGGDIYRIFVSYPATEAPADGYPVLYVLDGNAVFATFAETRLRICGSWRSSRAAGATRSSIS